MVMMVELLLISRKVCEQVTNKHTNITVGSNKISQKGAIFYDITILEKNVHAIWHLSAVYEDLSIPIVSIHS